MRWEAYEQIGGFDERYFMYMEDVDLVDRFSSAGWNNFFCQDAIITHAKGHSTQAARAPKAITAGCQETGRSKKMRESESSSSSSKSMLAILETQLSKVCAEKSMRAPVASL